MSVSKVLCHEGVWGVDVLSLIFYFPTQQKSTLIFVVMASLNLLTAYSTISDKPATTTFLHNIGYHLPEDHNLNFQFLENIKITQLSFPLEQTS
jgi:hypothetical protein